MTEDRLQKILSSAGFGSRRTCEEIIKGGRVLVNRNVAQIGMKADPQKDSISVDGKIIKSPKILTYVLLYKPRGVISSLKSQDRRPIARNLIPLTEYLYPVGRLDYDSEGLMLFTNDGELAARLTHPRYEHEKEYLVLVSKTPDQKSLKQWREGILLRDGYKTNPASVRFINEERDGVWLSVTLKEGHKRQIREMGKATNLPVKRIVRIRMGNLMLNNLQPGQWRKLSHEEISALRKMIKNTQNRANSLMR